jgi:Xaa-Pro aminopeptidase
MKTTARLTASLFFLLSACATPPVHMSVVEVLDPPLYEVRTLPDPATPAACRERRARTARALGDGLLVLGAGDEGEERFEAANDFYWLTGVASPDAVFVLAAEDGQATTERLYLHPEDKRWELWNGARLAPGEETERLTGIADTRPLEHLTADLAELRAWAPAAYGSGVDDAEEQDASVLLAPLQVVKEPAEIAALRVSIDITQEALVEAMRQAVPGSYEFEAEARILGGFRKRGAEGLAFASICGSGPNSCCLHYRANERRMEDGDLLVMDVGAKFRHYCADVTRTIPVNGRFTPRQREIYTHVYEASRAAARVLKPGASLGAAHRVATEYLEERGYGKYFPHGVGHGLGLLVHDAPAFEDELAPGMVVTIEPGIYIAAEELGVRIEDDYLITVDGAELLSKRIPAQPDELEAFLASLRSSTSAASAAH